MKNFEELESRYQSLLHDFQTNKIDENSFTTELDQLQFQDEWGRYWMIGAQSGAWHYYDGQAWHQADPREADKLPIIDENGVYWQKGTKSGEWYYYQADTDQWVQPENPTPEIPTETNLPAPEPSADMPTGFEGELFQDEEGRYWSVGAKTGQWYFYDHNGWHPAHELQSPGFQGQPAFAQPVAQPAPAYQPPVYQMPPGMTAYPPPPQMVGTMAQPYMAQSMSQPVAQPPIQVYVMSPEKATQPQPQPIQPPVAPAPAVEPASISTLPKEEIVLPRQMGTASTINANETSNKMNEVTAVEPFPLPKEHEVQPRRAAVEPEKSAPKPEIMAAPENQAVIAESGAWYYFDGKKLVQTATPPPAPEPSAPVTKEAMSVKEATVAEFIDEDDIEVVDVEVVTVIEPEDENPAPKSKPVAPMTASKPTLPEWTTPLVSSGVPTHEEVKPRQTSRPVPAQRPRQEQEVPPPQARAKTNTQTGLSRTAGAVVIPTGADPSTIAPRPNRPVSRPVRTASGTNPAQVRQTRARENTLPLEDAAVASRIPVSSKPLEVDQTIPTARPRSDSDVMRGAPATTLPTGQMIETPQEMESSIGSFFHASPTMWMAAIGLVVLLVGCGIIFVGGNLVNRFGLGNTTTSLNATPTLDTNFVNKATPTLVPTQTPTKAIASPTVSALIAFNSKDLGFSVKYPEGWQIKESKNQVIFAPSSKGLDPKNLTEPTMWIERSAEKSIVSDLLADALAQFPLDAKTLNEHELVISAHKWTSALIQFKDENFEGAATLAVTVKDGQGYTLIVVAPGTQWDGMRFIFQDMLNSFNFTGEGAVAEAKSSPTVTGTVAITGTAVVSASAQKTPEATVESKTSPTPTRAALTPPTKIPPTATLTPTITSTPTPKLSPTPTPTLKPLTYAVQSGDSLSSISADFGVSIDLLATENGLNKESAILSIGQELVIPFTKEELEAYNRKNGTPSANATPAIKLDVTLTPGTVKTGTVSETAKTGQATPTAEAASNEPAKLSGHIVYPAFDAPAGTYNLWLADVTTNEQVIIAGQASQPAFSRDGSLLAYRSWDLSSRGIVFRDFIGGRGGQVTRFVEDGLPSWSPDGFSFVITSRREGDRVPRLFRGDQKGQGERGISFEGAYPDTLPDGRLVARGCLVGGNGCGLYILGPLGGGEVKIGTDRDTAPAAAPVGGKITFMSDGRGGNNWEIWTMSTDGSNAQQLTKNGNNDGLPTWSPDGKSIAYVSDQGGGWAIWVMNADGSNQRKLFAMKGGPDGKVLRDIDNSKGWLEERISWAP